jgi:predicted Zn finger-like uncharacterized protein
MPITTTCPGCKALFRLPEELAGKQVRCQKCEQLFAVPLPITGTPSAVEPPVDEPILAPIAEPTAPKEEPILATVIGDAPPKEEPILATVAVPSEKNREPQAKPTSQKAPPPDRPVSVAMLLAMIFLFLAVLLCTGTFAAIWVAGHLSPPLPLTVVPPLHAGGIVNFNGGFQGGPKRDDRFANDFRFGEPVEFGFDGTVFVRGQTQNQPGLDHAGWNRDGAYRRYRVRLLANTKYNFLLSTPNNQGRLRIVDPDANLVRWDVEGKVPANRLMTTFTPDRTREYVLWVNAGFNSSDFELSIAMASNPEVIPRNLKGKASVAERNVPLRLSDPLDLARPAFGPYREYELAVEANQDYLIRVSNAPFTPALVIDPHQNARVALSKPGGRGIDYVYRAAAAGKVRIRVTSQQCGLGNYDLTVSRRTEAPEMIMMAVGETDQRALTAKDPIDPMGSGPHKRYPIKLQAGELYVFDMKSNDFTTRLSLFDPENRQVRVGNVKKNGKDSQMTFRPPATGTYTIRAASTNNGQGQYTLTIERQP